MRRDDDAGRARTLGAARDRPEVVRIGHLVEADEQWTLSRRELVGIGVAKWLAPGDDPLVVAGAGCLAQLPLGLDVRARSGVEPRSLSCGALGDPDLEHLAWPAVELSRRVPAVDELARHRRRTSR